MCVCAHIYVFVCVCVYICLTITLLNLNKEVSRSVPIDVQHVVGLVISEECVCVCVHPLPFNVCARALAHAYT